MWNKKRDKYSLAGLRKLLSNAEKTYRNISSVKISFEDGTSVESNDLSDDFLVQGYGILYVQLKDDPILLTNISETLSLHGEFVNGCLHGSVFGTAQWWKYPMEQKTNEDGYFLDDNPLYTELNFAGNYRYGKLKGPIWKPGYSLDAVPIGYYYTDALEESDIGNTNSSTNQIFDIRYNILVNIFA